MGLLIFATALLPLLAIASQIPMVDMDEVQDQYEKPVRIVKRESSSVHRKGVKYEDHHNFTEEKLVELTQAMQHLLQLAQDNGKTIKALVENFSRLVQKPRLPEKIEVEHHSPRTGEDESRRFNAGKPVINFGVPTFPYNVDEPNSWCSVAVLCLRTVVPVCGYDDKFGYGRFDDLCHMLQVNCYWKYNFAIVSSCNQIF